MGGRHRQRPLGARLPSRAAPAAATPNARSCLAQELVNLAALGFAPATLVAPLGCLSVVFNAFTAVFWLREPFFKRDLLGLALISAGVSCIVMGQVGAVGEVSRK